MRRAAGEILRRFEGAFSSRARVDASSTSDGFDTFNIGYVWIRAEVDRARERSGHRVGRIRAGESRRADDIWVAIFVGGDNVEVLVPSAPVVKRAGKRSFAIERSVDAIK